MKFNSISQCFLFIAVCVQPSPLNAQTECELLKRPPTAGGFLSGPHDDFYRVRSVLTTERMGLLTQDQRDSVQDVNERLRDIIVSVEAEAVGREDAEDFEANEIDRRLDQVAPQLLADLERALGDDWPSIVFDVNRSLASSSADPSGLSLSTVIEGLNFTIDQQNQLEKLGKEIQAINEKKKAELSQSLKSLFEEHFENVISELDTSQRARFLNWFGDLQMFEKVAFSVEYRDLVARISGQRGSERIVENTVRAHGQPPVKRKDVEIDSLLFLVLTKREIDQQLTLSPEQVAEIKRKIFGNDIRLIVSDRRLERMESLLADNWELPDWLDKILLEHQKNWLREFEFQVYILPYADSFGVLQTDVSIVIGLTTGQKGKISELASNYQAKVTELIKTTNQTILQAELENQAKKLSLLNPEQTNQYRRWFGTDAFKR